MVKKMSSNKKAASPIVEPEHIRHSLPLLQLLASQLQSAISDNNQTIAELTTAYAAITTMVQPVIEKQRSKPALKQQLHEEMNRIVTAFQGHDAFNQRMEHISSALDAVSRQLGDSSQRDLGSAWEQLTHQLSSSYTTTQERSIHEKVKRNNGRGVRCSNPDPDGGSIELF